MDLYEVEVWNKVDKFWDKYLVRAWSVTDAKTMTRCLDVTKKIPDFMR